jgi:two-component system, LytTR family, sensor kinase
MSISNAAAQKRIDYLENHLDKLESDAAKCLALNEIAGFYTFTNIREAQKRLAELERLLQKGHHSELLLNFHLNTAIVENQFYNYRLSEIHFRKALDIVENEGNVSQLIEVLIDFAGTLINMNQLTEAADLLDRADRQLKSFPDDILYMRLLCREGNLWLHYTDYDRATELLFQSDKICSNIDADKLTIKDLYFQTLIYSGLGLIFEKTGDTLRSINAYRRVVEMSELAGIRSRLAWHYLNIGKAYMTMNDYVNSEEFFQKTDSIKDDISQSARAHATANLGYCHYLSGRYEEALEHYNRAEQIYRRSKDIDYENLSIISRRKGILFNAIGKPKRGEKRLFEALKMANLGKNTRQQAILCQDIAEFYADQNDYRNAYDYEVLQNKFVRRYYEETNKIKVDELEFKYEADRRRKEAEMLRLQATGLQLKALRAQMNPHFMFNALNSIQHHIQSEDRELAAMYLAKFAKLMRSSLEYSELEIISLENEIEFLDDYLAINQKLRFDGKLEYAIIVDEEIEDDITGVPTMIVQPYIENAIEHGIRPKKGGFIKIEFKLVDDDSIICIIEDNGIGRVKAKEYQDRDNYHLRHKSRGVSITERRLEILHSTRKDKFSTRTIDLYDPTTNEALGTRVEVQIPIVELTSKAWT